MRRLAFIVLLGACAATAPAKAHVTGPTKHVAAGTPPTPTAVGDKNTPPAITISPVAMAGPYTSIMDACTHAPPCGGTEIDPRDPLEVIKPPKTATCTGLSRGGVDPNANDSKGRSTKLEHDVGDLRLQIASQSCAVPGGSRWEHDVYYAFVRRGGGWWRSAPLWEWNYSEK